MSRSTPQRRRALLLSSLNEGSPERERQVAVLSDLLPEGWTVLFGALSGHPSIEQAVRKLDDGHGSIEEVVLLPLYPHFSQETTGAVLREVYRVMIESRCVFDLTTRARWFNDSGYVNAQARLAASFASSNDLDPDETDLFLVAHRIHTSAGELDRDYEEEVGHSAQLVVDRLGWPVDKAAVLFRSETSPNEPLVPLKVGSTSPEPVIREAAKVVLVPFTISGAGLAAVGAVEAACADEIERSGREAFVASRLDAFDPFVTVLKNLALRGPRPVLPGADSVVPLMAPKRNEEPLVERNPKSLVMIGASVSGKLRAEHGPEVVHSPPGVFSEVKKTRKELRAFLDWVREETPFEESFVWSTCQRIEFYGWHAEAENLGDYGWPVAEIRQQLYGAEPEGLKVNVLFGVEGWHHLMRTACGLNSALPGDTDVVEQLQTACRMAERIGTAGRRVTDLVENAGTVAQEARERTSWARFSRGFCAAALSRIHDLSGADLERARHIVIGGSATSRSVLATLSDRYRVEQRQMTLVYRDHHGQMKLLRNAIGNGTRLRVHSYSETNVLNAIADADFVFFGIDHSKPVLTSGMLAGMRDFEARPLVIVDFNDSGSVSDLNDVAGVSLWTAGDLDRAVESYADAMCADKQFGDAVEQVERWIAGRVPGADDD